MKISISKLNFLSVVPNTKVNQLSNKQLDDRPLGTKLLDKQHSGFTLIELMITVFIISLLAAVALPSYRQYMKKNTESQTVSDLLQLSGELNQWRAKALTYAGFEPKFCREPTNRESDKCDNDGLTSPIGRDDSLYKITIKTIVGGKAENIKDAKVSNNWIMIAKPTDSGADLNTYAMTSMGVQCFSNASVTAIKVWQDGNCGTGGGSW